MTTTRLIATLAVAVAACGKPADKRAEPFQGPLTLERLRTQEGDNGVPPCANSWDDAFAQLQAAIGPPTQTKPSPHGTQYTWIAAAGDRCVNFVATKGECSADHYKPGPRLHSKFSSEYRKGDPGGSYELCVAAIAANQPARATPGP